MAENLLGIPEAACEVISVHVQQTPTLNPEPYTLSPELETPSAEKGGTSALKKKNSKPYTLDLEQ